jgi:hypothetical protein
MCATLFGKPGEILLVEDNPGNVDLTLEAVPLQNPIRTQTPYCSIRSRTVSYSENTLTMQHS